MVLESRVSGADLPRFAVSIEVFPWAEQCFPVGVVERPHSDAECEEGAGHGDGRDDADEEVGIVPLPDALVEPLAVVVEHVHALVADRAMFGTLEIVKMTIHASLIFQGFIYRDVLGYNDTVDTVNSNYSAGLLKFFFKRT